MFKSGFIAIAGRPNVGKSTLLNAIVGEKLAITSSKPQTTRNRITGIRNTGDGQFIFLDTPGIHHAKTPLNRCMVRAATSAFGEVDLILFLVEADRGYDPGDGLIIESLQAAGAPVFLVINKIDLAPLVGASLEVMDRDAKRMRGERPFVFTNLKTGQGLDAVIAFIEAQGMLSAAR